MPLDFIDCADISESELEDLKLQIPAWIKCSDRMPDEDGRYIVCSRRSWVHVEICSLRQGKWDIELVSHWMPLPNPPSDVKESAEKVMKQYAGAIKELSEK